MLGNGAVPTPQIKLALVQLFPQRLQLVVIEILDVVMVGLWVAAQGELQLLLHQVRALV